MSGKCDICGIHVVDCRCQLRIDHEFIQRVMSSEYQEKVKQHYKEYIVRCNKWSKENPDLRNECVSNYSKTEKGKIACKKREQKRREREKEAMKDLTWEERKQIGRFYKNCPSGYEVDHIIPLCKGGKHCLSNLQYLTKEDNRKKGRN